MDWDIAFHRYILRLNGGCSGPSCFAATKVAGEYDEVTSVPAGAPFVTDDQTDAECRFRADEEAGDPANERDWGTALRGYYLYDGCLKMTGTVFAIRLADRRTLKLTVTHYCAPQAQAECDETCITSHEGAANLQIRLRFWTRHNEEDAIEPPAARREAPRAPFRGAAFRHRMPAARVGRRRSARRRPVRP